MWGERPFGLGIQNGIVIMWKEEEGKYNSILCIDDVKNIIKPNYVKDLW